MDGITRDDVIEYVLPKKDWEGVLDNAKKAEVGIVGGRSQIRGPTARTEMLSVDQLVGQIANYAGSVVLTGSASGYWQAREVANANPYEGDGGVDIIGFPNVDVKGSLMRNSQDPLDYRLLVREKERHDEWIYVLALVPQERPYKAFIVGWAKDADLPEQPYGGPIESLHGAFDIKASRLRNIEELRIIDDESEYYWSQMYGEDYLHVTAKVTYERCAFCGGFNVHSEPCKELQYGWNVMEFGKHKGKHIDTVPDGYLEFLIIKGIKGPKDRGKWLEKLQERSEKYNSIYWEEMAKRVTT